MFNLGWLRKREREREEKVGGAKHDDERFFLHLFQVVFAADDEATADEATAEAVVFNLEVQLFSL